MTGRWDAFKIALKAAWRAWCKARPIHIAFDTGIANPSMARLDSGEGDPELQLPEDQNRTILYRDQYGGFATETQIRLGLKRLQGPFVFAQSCNDETADMLVDEIEAMIMDGIELQPMEQVLLNELKQQLRERDVK